MSQTRRAHGVVVTPGDGEEPPSEEAIRAQLAREGLQPYAWSNGPGYE